MSKELWRCTPSFNIYTQDIEGELHVHCDVKKWSPSVLKTLYVEFVMLKIHVRHMGYEEMFSISPNSKFCELFCAESIGTYENYEVMRWDLS